MARRAWDDLIQPPLPGRSVRVRTSGLTMVIDKGLGIHESNDLLDLASDYIDFWKLPFGTSAFYPEGVLRKKIELCRSKGVDPYPGGTFLEVAFLQGQAEPFLERAQDLGFTAVEVSDGTVNIPSAERQRLIRSARQLGLRVLSEIGKKEIGKRVPLDEMHRLISQDLEAGSERIIVEGRESGKGVGIYAESGEIEADDLEKVLAGVEDPTILIWEAPLQMQQEELIHRFGPNVNLGNIPPGEILALESLRVGLRADTLRWTLPDSDPQLAGAGLRPHLVAKNRTA